MGWEFPDKEAYSQTVHLKLILLMAEKIFIPSKTPIEKLVSFTVKQRNVLNGRVQGMTKNFNK